MSNNSNSINVPEARQAMENFKMECANEVGVDLKQGYNGDLTSRQAGSVGGQMVTKMIEAYERSMSLTVSYNAFQRLCTLTGAEPFTLKTLKVLFNNYLFLININSKQRLYYLYKGIIKQ